MKDGKFWTRERNGSRFCYLLSLASDKQKKTSLSKALLILQRKRRGSIVTGFLEDAIFKISKISSRWLSGEALNREVKGLIHQWETHFFFLPRSWKKNI